MTHMFRDDLLRGKRILMTGGGSGLGKMMTERYIQLGADVYIMGRRGGLLETTAAELHAANPGGGRVLPLPCDIRDADAVDAAVATAFADAPLTGLVNNAAGNFIAQTKDLSHRGFNAVADIVFRGTFYVTHAVGKRWIEGNHPGSVISIVTTWADTGSPFVVPSAMSKAGIATMTKSLAIEWGPRNIRLNAIAPGPFPTEGAWERLFPEGTERQFNAPDKNPSGRVGKMFELANLATFLMADGCDYLSGEVIAIDGAAHLAGGANFSYLLPYGEEDWQRMREAVRAVDAKDKEKRG
jgi:NAD(P)-dependent dehydrogenase (short-subunit alcohol dehydrogenase family)